MNNMHETIYPELPSEIQGKVKESIEKGMELIKIASQKFPNVFDLDDNVLLNFVNHSNTNFFNERERAQIIYFSTKYEKLSDSSYIEFDTKSSNIDDEPFRNLLNDYRPIFFNRKDCIYYTNINSFLRQKFNNNDAKKGTEIIVSNGNGMNITEEFLKNLEQKIKCISFIISRSDLKYIYSSIVQHSDAQFLDKYINDYESGKIPYILLKNITLLKFLKYLLYTHYEILRRLTSIKVSFSNDESN